MWPTRQRLSAATVLVLPHKASRVRVSEAEQCVTVRGPLFYVATTGLGACTISNVSPESEGTPSTVELLWPRNVESSICALSIAELRRLIFGAGLRTDDCLEKVELRARARKALVMSGRCEYSSTQLTPKWLCVPPVLTNAESVYATLTAAADWMHDAAAAGEPVLLAEGDWAKASAAAYAVRWLGAPAQVAVDQVSISDPQLRLHVLAYCPIAFSLSLFQLSQAMASASTPSIDTTDERFAYYARCTVAFVAEKASTFGGCEFQLYLNEAAASHDKLLQRLHEVALGRIAFVEVAFDPRPRVAPWLLAAMRLAPLLEWDGRTVATMDVHDDSVLQHQQLRELIGRLWETGRELALTFWIADDAAADCLVESALPVPSAELSSLLPDQRGPASKSGSRKRRTLQKGARRRKRRTGEASSDSSSGDEASETAVHAHTDAGMAVAVGSGVRSALLHAHGGVSFVSFLMEHVKGAAAIPHGIEEMALDGYLHAAGWAALSPQILLSVHRSLLVGRGVDESLAAEALAHVIDTPLAGPHLLNRRRVVLDVGPVRQGLQLATCRHSRLFDCAADSHQARERALAAQGWRGCGHRLVGQRVCRVFEGDLTSGTITRWLPADGEDGALFHCTHDDGDEEDLEEYEAMEAMRLASVRANSSRGGDASAIGVPASSTNGVPGSAQHVTASGGCPRAAKATPATAVPSAAAGSGSARAQCKSAGTAPAPVAGGAQDDDISSLSIVALRRVILGAGLRTDDCLEKHELRERAREALAVRASAFTSGKETLEVEVEPGFTLPIEEID